MSYVQQVLQPEETVRFRTTVHWSSFLSAIVALVIGLTLLVGTTWISRRICSS